MSLLLEIRATTVNITKCYQQLIVSDASIQLIGVLVVDNLVRPAKAWEITFTQYACSKPNTHAQMCVMLRDMLR